ncbi:hypothetical protein [Streptomyces johnsoniae]|uniref:Uncharacterized protein n=1 Tax=Streptomyces johnsoniae TaxID=3075532 RepID=A0ABU2S7T1_9ACTN|nr:hypothetical protein [Streptomyces sp. DSM 41886]MDT0445003.1 hypothetical protein [Streptomyces sp. DSM 41886]
MCADLSPVIAATTQWLLRAYPAADGPLAEVLAEVQARQAVTVAAWLRYPTEVDAALVALAGPGGSARLDWVVGADTVLLDGADFAWRTWVDEAVASWAACLLTSAALAERAVATVARGEHASSPAVEFRRLTDPAERDRRAAALLRHPDLTAPVAELHRAQLLSRLAPGGGAASGAAPGAGQDPDAVGSA